MKKLLIGLLFTLIGVSPSFAQFGASPFVVNQSSISLQFGESILNTPDGRFCFRGVGGTNNEDICFDVEGTSNRIDFESTTGANVIFFNGISILFNDGRDILLGNGSDNSLSFETQGNDNLQLGVTTGAANASGYFSIVEKADVSDADRSPTASWPNGATPSDPTFCVTSADATSALDNACIWHDQTNANLGYGTGNLTLVSSEVPNLSSCGTSPTIAGNGNAGKVTIGTSASDTCTLTFDVAYTNAPSCVVTGEDTSITLAATTTTSTLVITAPAATDFSSDVINYACFGY
jgi:hypothetical protein